MPLRFTCALTEHDTPFVIDAAEGACASLKEPTVQDLLEDLAELHEYYCACDTVVGRCVSVVSPALDKDASSPHEHLAAIPLALHTCLHSLGPEQSHLLVSGDESSPNDFLRASRSKKYTSLTVDGGTVLQRLGPQPILPPSIPIPYAVLCSTPGSVFVDKSAFVRVLLHKLSFRHVNVLRRPPGFGKTTLLSMLDAFFDAAPNPAHFPFIFDETMKAVPAFHSRRQLLVFSLDLAELVPLVRNRVRGQDLEDTCREFLDSAAHKFYVRYRELLCAPESATMRSGFSATFGQVVYWSQLQDYPWCFLIDNYTAPSVSCADPGLEFAISRIIFGRLAHLIQYQYVYYGLVVGEPTPGVLDWEGMPSNWNDLTDDPQMAAAIGFTQAEVVALARVMSADLPDALQSALSCDDGQLAYASADVLALIRQLLGGEILSAQPNISSWKMAVARPEDDLPLQQILRRNCEILFGQDYFVSYDNRVRTDSNAKIVLPIPAENNWVWDDEDVDGDEDTPLPEFSFASSSSSSNISPPSPSSGNQELSSRSILNNTSKFR